jgi:hypothetical protein
MSQFYSALKRVFAAVHSEFDSDEQLSKWLSDLNAECAANAADAEAGLNRLLSNLGTGWVSSMLVNEDRAEEHGVLAEAVMTEIRGFAGSTVTRSVFSYRLASRIVNRGIRPLNRSARRLEPNPAIDAFLQSSVRDETTLSEEDYARYDRMVAALLEKETRSNEVATARITMDVKRVWEDALRAVDAELGGANARPMSAAVKQVIASRLGVPVTTVEAAMKRYKRAVKRVLATARLRRQEPAGQH